jgi:serine protease AprX
VEAIQMSKRFLILAVALFGLLALPASALAADQLDNAKIDSSVQTVIDATGGDVAVPVIVYAPDNLGSVDAVIPDVVDTTNIPLVDGVAAYLTPDEIASLADQDYVTGIVADNPVSGVDYASSMDITNLAIGLSKVASPADGGPSGDGVTVAVLDSGVSSTSDLGSSRIVGWKDFVNGRTAPYDDAGHGTFVAGLIAGDGTASLPLDGGGQATMQFRGVAPAANIVGIKVLDSSGEGRTSSLVAGIAWAIAHKNQYGIRVLNISIGGDPVGPSGMDPIDLACEAAWKSGIVVVCAAGNEGDFGMGGVLSPGNDPYVLTVGATDTRQTPDASDDAVAAYSSWGPTLFDEYAKPDIVAPGNRLISLRVPGSYIDTNFPANLIPVNTYIPAAAADATPAYLMLSGTSTSTPVAAGAAALLLQQNPRLSPDDVKVRLMDSADPISAASPYQDGAGMLDVPGALKDRSHARGYALSADLGNGLTILSRDTYAQWEQRVWADYGWTKFKWTKFKWTKFKWTDVAWTKFKWTKFKWTDVAWTKFKWTKFKWTQAEYDAMKFKWTKFKWTILTEGQ